MRRVGLDMLTAYGMSPLDHLALAAKLGCSHISIGLAPVPWQAPFFAPWSLRDDNQLQQDLVAMMKDLTTCIAHVEGFAVKPGANVESYGADLDIVAALGVKVVSSVCMEPDRMRALDQFSLMADMVAERGMMLHLEFAPPHPLNTLEKTQAFLKELQPHRIKLVIDAMHFFRSGATLADLAKISPSQIGHAQLCDVPLRPSTANYYEEACFERRIPGDGDLPLVDFVKLLPRTTPIGLEIPMRRFASSRQQLESAIIRAVNETDALLASVDCSDPLAR